jgi:hypothetical protein
VYVVIDGDGAIFQDKYLSAGADGGAQAAQDLYAKIRTNVATLYPEANTQEWSIVVNVILNVEGVFKPLQANGIIKSIGDLHGFGRAFARTQPLFSFVDVGYGKEQADHKIRENLRFMIRIGQCKHVLFGPCHDNGYLPVLEEYKRNPSFASRITLLSGTAPEPGFRQLGFGIEKYGDIFRTAALGPAVPTQHHPPSPKSTPPSTTPPSGPVSTAGPKPLTTPLANSSYAKASTTDQNPIVITVATKKPAVRKFYLVNAYDERIDMELPRPDPAAEKRYMERVRKLGYNYCNKYHLLDDCPNGSYCCYEHGEKLPPAEIGVLRFKCRNLKCTDGSYCAQVDCPFSHHCRMGNRCTLDNCRFAESHGTNLVRGFETSFTLLPPLRRVKLD